MSQPGTVGLGRFDARSGTGRLGRDHRAMRAIVTPTCLGSTPMPTTVGHLLDVARAEIGTAEHPRGSNRQKYGAWGGFNGVAWCSWFTCWVAHHAGAPELVALRGRPKGSAYSGDIYDKYRAQGRVSMTPAAGDFVVFDWPRAGTQNDHIGIVEAADRWGVHTIEGNSPGIGFTYDVVGRHLRTPMRYVRGYCHPVYSGATPRPTPPNPTPKPKPLPEEDDMYLVRALGDASGAIYLTNGQTRRWIQDQRELDHWLMLAPQHRVEDWPFPHVARLPFVGQEP